jgi:8-oxo-dGTP diphosphatase / 2-hydroxy-dATP diphosphatase
MRPEWHTTSSSPSDDGLPVIPYAQMWADDEYWFPLLLERKRFIGRADFRKEPGQCDIMQRYWFGVPTE